jgi:hypothetical protein
MCREKMVWNKSKNCITKWINFLCVSVKSEMGLDAVWKMTANNKSKRDQKFIRQSELCSWNWSPIIWLNWIIQQRNYKLTVWFIAISKLNCAVRNWWPITQVNWTLQCENWMPILVLKLIKGN